MLFSIGYTEGIYNVLEELGIFDKIYDVYYSPERSILTSARSNQKVDDEELNKLRDKGIKINYLINGADYDNSFYTEDNITALIEEIIICNPDIVTLKNTILFNSKLIDFLNRNNIIIKNSINNKIKTLNDVKLFHKRFGVTHMILDRSLNRDTDSLTEIVQYCKENNITTTILLNEGCIPSCPYKEFCDLSVSKGEDYAEVVESMNCGHDYVASESLFLKSPFILPSNLNKYSDLGVDIFKIATRGKELGQVKERLKAYVLGNRNVNLHDLVDTNPSFIFKAINTNMLEEYHFSDNTSNCKNNCFDCEYCDTVFEDIKRKLL